LIICHTQSRVTLRPNIKFRYGDVRYKDDIEPLVKWCDVVYHLAAQIHVDKSITNPQETIDTNILGTMNILEAVKKYDKEMIFDICFNFRDIWYGPDWRDE
jgi:dTDP-glucose 4,6-dehydratase